MKISTDFSSQLVCPQNWVTFWKVDWHDMAGALLVILAIWLIWVHLNKAGSIVHRIRSHLDKLTELADSDFGYLTDMARAETALVRQCLKTALASQYLFSIRSWDEGLVQPAAFWQIQRIILKKYYCEHTFFQNRLTISIHKQCDSNAV